MSIFQLLQKIGLSFQYACQGLLYVFKTERNMKIHAFFALLALLLSYFLKISQVELLFVLTAIFFVFSMEVVNTALETVVDLHTTEYHPLAKIAKDAGAAAVLLAAIFALIIGVYVFALPFLSLFGF